MCAVWQRRRRWEIYGRQTASTWLLGAEAFKRELWQLILVGFPSKVPFQPVESLRWVKVGTDFLVGPAVTGRGEKAFN